jgi:hypothetical protein
MGLLLVNGDDAGAIQIPVGQLTLFPPRAC